MADPVGNGGRFVALVVGGVEGELVSVARGGPQSFSFSSDVLGDDPVGGGEDVLG